MQDELRLGRLEDGLRQTQDSILLMGKDIHQMNLSITSIASSMKSLVEVQQDMKIMDERYETRHRQLKESDDLLHRRIDTLAKTKDGIESKADNGNRAYNILLFMAKALGTLVVGMLFGMIVWLIKAGAVG